MTASPDIDRLFQEGVSAIRAGDKATGREKLLQVVELDEMHEQGWLWLSATVETDEDRIVCLENVLTINPGNENAQRGLEKLTGRATPAPPPSAQAEPPPPAASPPPAPAEPSKPATPASIPDPPVPTPPQAAAPDLDTPSEPELLTPAASGGGSLLNVIEARSREKEPSGGLLFDDDDDEPARPPSPPGSESWRQTRAEVPPPPARSRSGGASSAWARDADAEPSDRNILDLFDAWFAAMLFNARGSFALELPVSSFDRVLVNLLFTGLIAAMGGIFQFLLIVTLGGGSMDAFAGEQFGELIDVLNQAGMNMSGVMGIIGIIYLVSIVIGQVLSGLFTGVGVHAASRMLGGSGEMIETLHLLTMASVAYQIVNLLPMIIMAVVPGLSDILRLATFAYSAAINVFAISYVHQEFGIGKSILALILGGFLTIISLGIIFCCLIFALASALGAGAS